MEAVRDGFNEDEFVALLEKLIGESKHLQNSAEHTPKEDRGECPHFCMI